MVKYTPKPVEKDDKPLPDAYSIEEMKDKVLQDAISPATMKPLSQRLEADADVEEATVNDFILSDILEEEVSERLPNFKLVIRDRIKWDSDDIPDEYLTKKVVTFRRLTIREQEDITSRVARMTKKDQQRMGARGADYTETAIMISKAVRPAMKLDQIKELPIVVFLWLSFHLLKAQGIGNESFEELKNGLMNQETE